MDAKIKVLEVVELAKSFGAVVGVKHILDTDKEMVHFTSEELVDFFEGAKKQQKYIDIAICFAAAEKELKDTSNWTAYREGLCDGANECGELLKAQGE